MSSPIESNVKENVGRFQKRALLSYVILYVNVKKFDVEISLSLRTPAQNRGWDPM